MHFDSRPLLEELFFFSCTTEEPLRDHVITEDPGIRAVIGERALADVAVATGALTEARRGGQLLDPLRALHGEKAMSTTSREVNRWACPLEAAKSCFPGEEREVLLPVSFSFSSS